MRRFYVTPPPDLPDTFPSGAELDLLLIEMRQAFLTDAKLGTAIVNPRRVGLHLLADGWSPEATRWLTREGKVAACVEQISDYKAKKGPRMQPLS